MATHFFQLTRRITGQVAVFEKDASRCWPDEAEQGPAKRGLSTSRFPYQAKCLSFVNIETDIIHCFGIGLYPAEQAFFRGIPYTKVLHPDQDLAPRFSGDRPGARTDTARRCLPVGYYRR